MPFRTVAEQKQMLEGLDLAGAQKIKGRQVVDSSTFGPNSKITALERPGFVKFDNVEFRAVRDLGHVDSEYLKLMYKTGKNPYDIAGTPLVGHHFKQIDHRAAGGFIVEIPKNNHTIANKIQHPHGNKKGMGLPAKQKTDWSKTRQEFNKERAKQELIKRGELK